MITFRSIYLNPYFDWKSLDDTLCLSLGRSLALSSGQSPLSGLTVGHSPRLSTACALCSSSTTHPVVRFRACIDVWIGGSQTWFLKNPKSSNFGKNFLSYFSALKIDPEKRNFDIFRPRIFRKIAKTNSKLYCGQTTRKNENFEKFIFSLESA